MAKKKKNDLLILYIMFACMILVIFYMFILQPKMKKISELSKEIKTKSQELEDAKYAIEKKSFLEKQIKKMSGEIKYYEDRLPAKKEIPKLLNDLKSIADKSFVKIISIEPDTPISLDPESIYYEFSIILKLKSGYHELGHFINNLENLKRFIKVKNLIIKKSTTDSVRHDINLIVSTYIYSESVSDSAKVK